VQTERKTHEAWADLLRRAPKAGVLLHYFAALIGQQNSVVISQKTLAKLLGCSVKTVSRAVEVLVLEKYIEVVKLNGPGSVCAYVINDRVVFHGKRENLRYSRFSSVVVADQADQDESELTLENLRKVPVLFPELSYDFSGVPLFDEAPAAEEKQQRLCD
jgi:hypothetical protein